MNIAIVDDLRSDADQLRTILMSYAYENSLDLSIEVFSGGDSPHAVKRFQSSISVISVRKNRNPVFHRQCLQRTNSFESDESVIEESSGISSYPPLKPVTVTLPSPSVVTVSSVCHS